MTEDGSLASELYQLTAAQVVALLGRGEVSPLELVDAAVARIEATDRHLNALPTLCVDRARDHARRIMKHGRPDGDGPWLGGLPLAIKDLNEVSGVRTTFGSPIFAHHVPERSDILVEALEARGGIVLAKSNTPEFGAGASTFNEVLGKTRNPWNTDKSVAGSSGGAAAALAAGQVWLAHGSDLGGSLRIPASFNGVIGLRPSLGRVASGPSSMPFDTLSVDGPMARTARDTALFLDALCGEHACDPLTFPAPARSFLEAVEAAEVPRRIGFSEDLGIVPVDPEVAAICERAARRFEDLGAIVEPACPDFSQAMECFQTLRAAKFVAGHGEHLREHRTLLKQDIIWNTEKGLAQSAEDVAAAELARGALYQDTVRFFENYDLLLCPTVIVPPFDLDIRYVDEVQGHKFDNYVHWLALTFAVTLTACPALSAPAGMTEDGLPVGLQIIGPPRGEARILAAAELLERSSGLAAKLPIDPLDASGRALG